MDYQHQHYQETLPQHYQQQQQTMSFNTQEIAEWNNVAIRCLCNGDYDQAINTLRYAVTTVRDNIGNQMLQSLSTVDPNAPRLHDLILQYQQQAPQTSVQSTVQSSEVESPQVVSDDEDDYDNYNDDDDDDSFIGDFDFDFEDDDENDDMILYKSSNKTIHQIPSLDRISLSNNKTTYTRTASDAGGVFAFYDRAFIFTNHMDLKNAVVSADGQNDVSLLKQQNRLLTILLYNMALFHHLQGMKYNRSSELQSALKIYQVVLDMVQASIQDFTSNGVVDELLMLVLSLFNNMGHIYSNYMSDVQQTQTHIAWLQGAFFAAVRQQQSSILNNMDDYDFFHRYLYMTPDCQFSLAPAA